MINPSEYFTLNDNCGEIQIEVRATELHTDRTVWAELGDSFTADDLSAIAQFFENQARYMRGEHLN